MRKQIKILYTIPNFKTAGSQYVLLSLFRNIDRTVFDPYICIEKFPETIPKDIPEKRRLLFKWKGSKFQDVLGFRRFLKENEIDIVHSWDYKSNYLEVLSCRLANVKYLYTKKNNAWSKRWQLKSWLANYIAYDNPEMKDRFFKSLLFRNKISFIPHGVDTNIFKPLGKVSHQNFNIGCIGNIGANKNQLFVINALKGLPENMELHLYGDEEAKYRELLDAYLKDNDLANRVNFHGFIENKNIPSIFQSLDLFILPSIQEGLPVSILEAMACGVPVLSSDSGGGAKYLLDAKNIFDLNRPAELIQKIMKIYKLQERERAVLIEKGIQNIAKKHTLQMEVDNYERLYKTIISINS
ncbi:glycosyltransferase [Aequorivita sublithincola DSM 14238]|uniref:Glycosyltransferase n=1 Tax=Aequorivita sublithincola (strain DSM 14238 / LMG 21431 / ACAM 643 / 9-3) TaxID=746697 RepID=I3YXI7_AEQSU|nr:glycosyltransferase family 4 protein [Aequorivita sublithincola]AFL81705.1 glycosyltransferase [Aequorivita sublithincola DSM 14238]